MNTTPREKYNHFTSLKGISWGKLYPKFTNFVIIALAYACISPLVMGFASAGLAIFYLSYRHNLFFVIQPKLETKGRCYTRSLSQILTGVYVGELALIGLMGLRKATGPSILMAILFVGTAIYNHFANRFLNPLEDHLPTKLIGEGEGEEDALLAAEEGEEVLEEAHGRSRIHHLGRDVRVPHRILDPIARFFEPHIYTSHRVMKRYLKDADGDPPNYSQEDVENAYSHPNLTSKTPKIWLPSDKAKLSKKEIEANSKAGLTTTDDGAWLDEKSRVQFERDDIRKLPVWKETTPY
jgi:calcium permeable stress-gated cation channel